MEELIRKWNVMYNQRTDEDDRQGVPSGLSNIGCPGEKVVGAFTIRNSGIHIQVVADTRLYHQFL
jgi:hypothetical protein